MKKQQGATLAITLLLLFIVTLLGISSIQITHMQEKMSANLQDKELSFNAAESALAAGEAWILSLNRLPTIEATCSSYPCVQETFQNFTLSAQTASWWQSHSAVYNSTLENVSASPRYIIEFLQFVPDTPVIGDSSVKGAGVYYYQITSYGTGSTNNAISILQTTIARRF